MNGVSPETVCAAGGHLAFGERSRDKGAFTTAGSLTVPARDGYMVTTPLHGDNTRYAGTHPRVSYACRGWPPDGHPASTERSSCGKTGASARTLPVRVRGGHLVATLREKGIAPCEGSENEQISRCQGGGWLLGGHFCERRFERTAVHQNIAAGQAVWTVCGVIHRRLVVSENRRATAWAGRASAPVWPVHTTPPTSRVVQSSLEVDGNAQGGHQVAVPQELQGVWHV